jgi:hypothetical protein
MFVQHAQLKQLSVAAEKISRLHSAQSCVQLAFPGFPPQLCQAYLLCLAGKQKSLVLVAYYLMESGCSIFFVPKCGEVEVQDIDAVYEEGWAFVESMGFLLSDTDYPLLTAAEQKVYMADLPICCPPQEKQGDRRAEGLIEKEIRDLRECSLESFGRFLASL